MPGGNKSSVYLNKPGLKVYDFFVPPDIKELIAYIQEAITQTLSKIVQK